MSADTVLSTPFEGSFLDLGEFPPMHEYATEYSQPFDSAGSTSVESTNDGSKVFFFKYRKFQKSELKICCTLTATEIAFTLY